MYQEDLLYLILDTTLLLFYYTITSAFLENHLKPIEQKLKSYNKDIDDFLRKLDTLASLLEDIILCTIDFVGLYPNIPHEDGLVTMRKLLDAREDKTVMTDSQESEIIELVECVLKNNIFEDNTSFYKQLRMTSIRNKMSPPYAVIFMGDLDEKLSKDLLSHGGDIRRCFYGIVAW